MVERRAVRPSKNDDFQLYRLLVNQYFVFFMILVFHVDTWLIVRIVGVKNGQKDMGVRSLV